MGLSYDSSEPPLSTLLGRPIISMSTSRSLGAFFDATREGHKISYGLSFFSRVTFSSNTTVLNQKAKKSPPRQEIFAIASIASEMMLSSIGREQ